MRTRKCIVNTALGVMKGGTQLKQGIDDVNFAKRVELVPTGRHLEHREAVKLILDLFLWTIAAFTIRLSSALARNSSRYSNIIGQHNMPLRAIRQFDGN